MNLSETGCKYCFLCDPGFYANETRQEKCTPCPIGTFQSDFGATNCSDCPAGFESLYKDFLEIWFFNRVKILLNCIWY